MDLDNLQQNMNTRVVFKEPRGMVRWLQLLFAIIAVSTVCDFYSTIGIDITCPTSVTTSTTTTTTAAPQLNVTTPPATAAAAAAAATPANNNNNTAAAAAASLAAGEKINPQFVIKYPFDFQNIIVNNTCPGHTYLFKPAASLNGSPQFFVMTGFLSLFYAAGTLVLYLLFSSTYDSIPVMPVADLLITALLCLLWFVASSAFSSGVSMLKSTITYDNLKLQLCPTPFAQLPAATCLPNPEFVQWKSLNVGLVSGFASFFLWGFGLWFVYKETHFHTPRGPL